MGFEIENGVLKKYTEEPGVTEVVIPDGVTSIGNWAFNRCENLKSVTIPDSVTSVGESAFYYCLRLTDVTIGKNVNLIGRNAFSVCNHLKTIRFSGGLSKISGNIPVDKICVSDDEIRSGGKIDTKLINNIKTNDIELISYLIVYQTAKAWKQHIFDYIKKMIVRQYMICCRSVCVK